MRCLQSFQCHLSSEAAGSEAEGPTAAGPVSATAENIIAAMKIDHGGSDGKTDVMPSRRRS